MAGSQPITYQPQYRVTGATDWINFGSPVSGPPVTFTGLSGGTQYDFRVVAINNFGTVAATTPASDATTDSSGDPLDGFTAGQQSAGTDPKVVSAVRASVVAGQSVTLRGVSVSSSATSTCTLDVTCASGTLAVSSSSASNNNTKHVTVTDTIANLQTALATLAYTAAAAAGTDTVTVKLTVPGGAVASLNIAVDIDAAAKPSAVRNLAASNPQPTSVQLSWAQPQSGSTPFTYQPQYRLSGGSSWTAFGGAVSATNVTVTGLTASTPYDFSVIAINDGGSTLSTVVSLSTATPAGTAPSQPTNLQATNVTASGLTLSWAASTGSPSIAYQVQIRPHGNTATWANAVAPTNATSAAVTGLNAGVSYDLQVVASNSVSSATSPTLTQSTPAPVFPLVGTVSGTYAGPASASPSPSISGPAAAEAAAGLALAVSGITLTTSS